MSSLYPPQKFIAIDIDGTLRFEDGTPNERLIEWCRKKKSEGFKLMLWSMAGEEYAKATAIEFQVLDVFDIICSKPGYIVDDQAWGWTKYSRLVTDFNQKL